MELATSHNCAPRHISWLAGLTNAAGGVAYHWVALRYRRRLWTPYRLAVAELLRTWAPAEPELVLIGPSAGWNLDAEFLLRFQVVHAIEPDPLARWLLRRRFPRVRWAMSTRDYFSPHGPGAWPDRLAQLFADYPSQALLFFGFLGQLIVLHPDAVAQEQGELVAAAPGFVHWKAALRNLLAGRTWCSVHDRWVAHQPPVDGALGSGGALVPAESPGPAAIWPASAPVADVLTEDLVPDRHRQWLLWRRLPDRWHAMEAAWDRQPTRGNP